MSATHWYFIEKNSAQGPFTLLEMRTATAQGKVNPETLVCPAGDQTWSPAKNWPTLFPPKPPSASQAASPFPPTKVVANTPAPPINIATNQLPMATSVAEISQDNLFKTAHWSFNGSCCLLFLGRVIYFFHDKQITLLTLEEFVFGSGFVWQVLVPQLVLGLFLAWFMKPRVKWMGIAMVVIGIFSFLGSVALSVEAFRQRRSLNQGHNS